MNKNDPGFIVAAKRNPLYDDYEFRKGCNLDVINFVQDYRSYDTDGLKEFLFPWKKDLPEAYYCSEMINMFCIKHSESKINLNRNPDSEEDDDVTPYGIQRNPILIDVPVVNGQYQFRSMDYIFTTTEDDMLADAIRIYSAGFKRRNDLTVGTHAGIVVVNNGLWIAEMIGGGSVLSGIHKYRIRK